MKGFKKITVLIICVISIISVMVGCGDNNSVSGENNLEIVFWRAGLGDNYIKKIIEKFEDKYPEIKVKLNSKPTNTDIQDNLANGARYNSVDLYFQPVPGISYFQYLEPLNDILDRVNEGESKSVGQKIDPNLLYDNLSSNGNYYTLPYGGGVYGIVYNADLMTDIALPRTTNELRQTAILLNSKYGTSHKAFIHFSGNGYWSAIFNIWHAQYDGLDYYLNTFNTLGAEAGTIGTANENPDKSILTKKDGRFEAIKVLETIMSQQYVVAGSSSKDFTTAQTEFINGAAVMMVNGAWMINEMKNTKSQYTNFRVMKVPVISSIVDNLTSIKDDAKLASVIEAIDNGETSYDGVLEEDFNRVKEARNLIWQNYSQHTVCIPNYSDAKEAAKKFVTFYYSDEAQKILNDEIHVFVPFNYDDDSNRPDISTWNNFEQDMCRYAQTLTMVGESFGNRSSIFTKGSAMAFPPIDGNTPFIQVFIQDKKTSNYVWNKMVEIFDNNWNTYLNMAGLKND